MKNVDSIEPEVDTQKRIAGNKLPGNNNNCMNTHTENHIEEDEIDIVEIIKKLWRNRKLIMIVTFFFMVLGVVYAMTRTPMYQSTLSMYAASGEGKKGGFKRMAALVGIGVSSTAETYNISDVIKSRRIGKELALHKWSTKDSDEKRSLIEILDIKKGSEDRKIRRLAKRCSKMIRLTTNKETGLMKLSVMSIDPVLSAEMANYTAEAVTKYIQKHYGEAVEENIKHINNRLFQVKEELTKKELALKNYKENNRDINSASAQLEVARLMREVDIKQGVYLTLSQQKELAEIEKIKTKPVINVLDKAEVPFRKAKPNKTIICIAFVFFGGLLGIIIIVILPFIADNFGDFKLAKIVKK